MTIDKLILKSNQILKNAGIQSFSLDTQLLLAHFLDKSKLFILTNRDFDVENYEDFFKLVKRRENHEPMAYILGTAEFMSLPFNVNPETLIPRPDTETLVEFVISKMGDKKFSFLDVGTGSGCITVSIAKYCKNSSGLAVDISEKALLTARENAVLNGVNNQTSFCKMDILNECPDSLFDVLVSNPPYIETDVIPTLMEDVKTFEPYRALCGGDDGLIFYRRLSEIGKTLLNDNGIIAFEVGHTQSESVLKILAENGYREFCTANDLSGITRVVSARK